MTDRLDLKVGDFVVAMGWVRVAAGVVAEVTTPESHLQPQARIVEHDGDQGRWWHEQDVRGKFETLEAAKAEAAILRKLAARAARY